MSLRLVEITLGGDDLDVLGGVCDEAGALDRWTVETGPERSVVRVLVPQAKTEALTDLLVDRVGERPGFRVVILNVEATLPEENEKEKEAAKGPERVSREELYQDLAGNARVTPVYLVTVALSTVVAAVGLIRDDVAVVVGAMVIAPLLGPNVALSLAATLGDGKLAKQAILASVAGVTTALLIAVAIGAAVDFDPTAPQLLTRSRVGLGDVALGLAAGSAGALAFTSGLPQAVIGVMVAVALLPPTVAAGLYLGAGFTTAALGAAVLTFTNLTAINLAGVVTFLAQKVRPRTVFEEERARTARWVAIVTWLALLATMVALMIWVVGDPTPGATFQ